MPGVVIAEPQEGVQAGVVLLTGDRERKSRFGKGKNYMLAWGRPEMTRDGGDA